MKFYYLSTDPNNEGDYEIHHRECSKIPSIQKRLYLGPFNNGHEAMNLARVSHSKLVICEACQNVSMVPRFSHFNDTEPIHPNP
ncbi:hypothetical protein [Cognataquiflexum rubidum]|uniref:hypothetical protein n=1 Tax=Cognataquiflexum rubidum TaxID=2922273 RepID=UPI001F130013|nr:hypothetical protein [Cognataquiflexum rubidum]MCH6234371.1 hypothetical protein [Cognataquiflexum rubidum]